MRPVRVKTGIPRSSRLLRRKAGVAILRCMIAADPDRRSQLLRGVLDMCLLALLEDEPAYGYEVTRRLAARGLEVRDGSVYPLLARLERARLVAIDKVPSPSGPPRKYYRTTPAGASRLADWAAEWRQAADAVDGLVKGAKRSAHA
jgi:PadR family transcriptional regulator, regulatory protein PadR